METDITTRYLHDLPTLITYIQGDLHRATHTSTGRAGKPGSRPPMPLTPVDDIDAAWTCLWDWVDDWRTYYESDHLTPPRSYWPDLTSWLARHWIRARDSHPAAHDFQVEVRTHYRQVQTHLGHELRAWLPLPGSPACPILIDLNDCGGKLLEHQTDRYIRCVRCGETWHRDQYEQLAMLLGVDPQPVPISQAAKHAEIPIRTLRDWIERGWITTVDKDGPQRVMYSDVVTLQNRIREGI